MTKEKRYIPDTPQQQKVDDRPLPNPNICRAQRILPMLVECLVLRPRRCRYAFSFGSGYFCSNPLAKQIAAHTKAAEQKSTGK